MSQLRSPASVSEPQKRLPPMPQAAQLPVSPADSDRNGVCRSTALPSHARTPVVQQTASVSRAAQMQRTQPLRPARGRLLSSSSVSLSTLPASATVSAKATQQQRPHAQQHVHASKAAAAQQAAAHSPNMQPRTDPPRPHQHPSAAASTPSNALQSRQPLSVPAQKVAANKHAAASQEHFRPAAQRQPHRHALDTRKIVDPRTRIMLNIEPQINERMMRVPPPSSQAAAQQRQTGRSGSLSSDPMVSIVMMPPLANQQLRAVQNEIVAAVPARPVPAFDRPQPLVSKIVYRQIDAVAATKFNPVKAMASVIIHRPQELRGIFNRVTAKSLNVGRDSNQYQSLVQLDTCHHMRPRKKSASAETQLAAAHADPDATYAESASRAAASAAEPPKHSQRNSFHHAPRIAPRAKKSVSEAWLASLQDKPDASLFKPSHLEIDTISLPYPELREDSLDSMTSNQVPTISSIATNFDDSIRWPKYESSTEIIRSIPHTRQPSIPRLQS